MGQIRIELSGSFGLHRTPIIGTFSAMKHGHAHAIANAIEWLANDALPRAIAQDHQLQSKSQMPEEGFGLKDFNGP